MNLRNIGGGLGGLVIVAIVFFVRMGAADAKIGEYAEDTRNEFLASIASAEVCQGDQRNYVEWLALGCHEECWKNNHELESSGRRRTTVVVDETGYTREMLSAMMDMARRENAPHVAEGLGKVYLEMFPVE